MSKKPVATKTIPAKPAVKASTKITETKPAVKIENIPEPKVAPKKTPIDTNLKQMVNLIFDSTDTNDECYAVIDETTRVSAFLRHRDTCYIDCFDKDAMQPDRVRLAVISAIRYGKALVFDFIDMVDLIDHIEGVCSQVDPNLFKELCDRSILRDEKYLKYVKESDGENYKSYNFLEQYYNNFKVVFLATKGSDKFLALGKSFIVN